MRPVAVLVLGWALLPGCAPAPVDPRSDDEFARGIEAYLWGDRTKAGALLSQVPAGHPYHRLANEAQTLAMLEDMADRLQAGRAEAAAMHVGDDPWNAGMRAYYLEEHEEAVRQLSRVPESDEHYAKAMRFVGYNIYVRKWNRPKDGVPYVTRAYRAAPDDEKVLEDVERCYAKGGLRFPPNDEEMARILAAPLPVPPPPKPIERARSTAVKEEHRFLLSRVEGTSEWARRAIARRDAEADLDRLERAIEEGFSYAERSGADWRGALDAIRGSLEEEVPLGALALRLAKFMSLFGDGHSGLLVPPTEYLPEGYSPVLFGEHGGRVFAFGADRKGFLDPAHPYVVEMDGAPIARWLEAASTSVARGAGHFVRHHAVRNLRFVAWLRTELGLPSPGVLRLVLESADCKERREVERPLAPRKPDYGLWPRTRTRRLESGIGYLRIPSMEDDDKFLAALDRAMAEFRDTKGLVVDVRGNGGGSREALRRLFPYFMKPDDPPRVANVAAARATGVGAEGALSDRFLWPATASAWSADARARIGAFLRGFAPEWTPPPDKFSPWHVMLLERSANPAAYQYERPVVVLMDGGCFSATDIFLAALKGWRNVTLLGTPSGGGSGRARRVALPRSGIELRLSSMASFRPDGRLYDGRGVEPDVLVEPTPEDALGRTDTILDAAIIRLREAR